MADDAVSVAEKRDEARGELLAAVSDPFQQTMAELAAESGLSETAVQSFLSALKRRGVPLWRALGEVSRKETQELFEMRAHEILLAITDRDIEKASLQQKMTSAAIAIDKATLLSGQPTQIVSIQQLDNLDTLAGMVMNEMRRRGVEWHENPETGEVQVQPGSGYGNALVERAWKDPADEPTAGPRRAR